MVKGVNQQSTRFITIANITASAFKASLTGKGDIKSDHDKDKGENKTKKTI